MLPDDPLPRADAIVGVGHCLNYLPDADAVDRALSPSPRRCSPGGVLAIDLCDLEWAAARRDQQSRGWVGDDWAVITEFSACRRPIDTSGRWRRSSGTTTAPGAATTNDTTT